MIPKVKVSTVQTIDVTMAHREYRKIQNMGWHRRIADRLFRVGEDEAVDFLEAIVEMANATS